LVDEGDEGPTTHRQMRLASHPAILPVQRTFMTGSANH
jgi:hypothetical protein